MIVDRTLLTAALIVLGAVLVAGLALIVGHGLFVAARTRRLAPRLAAGRAALAEAATTGGLPPDGARALERLPFEQRVGVFEALVPSLSGAPRLAITGVAREIGLVTQAERRCASRSWKRRLRAVRLLTLVGGGEEAVPPLLGDPHVEVRTQSAEWAAEHPTPATIAALVAMLAEEEMLARFTVQDSLRRLGPAAVEALDGAIRRASGAQASGALHVAAGLGDPRLAAAALARVRDSDPRVRAGAARLLGTAGGEAAIGALERLLDDDAAAVRAAAAGSLGRLGHWPAGAALAAHLRDPAWDVRRRAALALRSFGAVGEVLLRRALHDEDRFARDMAELALGLPEAALPA